ncbi:hypothetical protein D3C72_1918220 [compost metagenome]
MLLEVVDQVLFVDRSGLYADLRAIQFRGAFDAQLARHQEALAVIEDDAGGHDPQARVAAGRDGRVAVQDVDLAGLQRGKALLRTERYEARLLGVAQYGGGQRAAQVRVQAGPAALLVGDRQARRTLADAAHQFAAFLDGVHRAGLCGAGDRQRRRDARRFE